MEGQRVIDAGEEFLRVQVCGICYDPVSLFVGSDIPTIVPHAEDVFGKDFFQVCNFLFVFGALPFDIFRDTSRFLLVSSKRKAIQYLVGHTRRDDATAPHLFRALRF